MKKSPKSLLRPKANSICHFDKNSSYFLPRYNGVTRKFQTKEPRQIHQSKDQILKLHLKFPRHTVMGNPPGPGHPTPMTLLVLSHTSVLIICSIILHSHYALSWWESYNSFKSDTVSSADSLPRGFALVWAVCTGFPSVTNVCLSPLSLQLSETSLEI